MKKLIYFYPFLISALLGEDKFICVRCFEIIGEYSAAACTRSKDFLEQVITTSDNAFMIVLMMGRDSRRRKQQKEELQKTSTVLRLNNL